MGTSVDEIRAWLEEGKRDGKSHVIVVCDTFDHEDYPVFVSKDQNPRIVAKEYDSKNMQKIMEVYNLSMDFDEQLNPKKRVLNWGEEWPPLPIGE